MNPRARIAGAAGMIAGVLLVLETSFPELHTRL